MVGLEKLADTVMERLRGRRDTVPTVIEWALNQATLAGFTEDELVELAIWFAGNQAEAVAFVGLPGEGVRWRWFEIQRTLRVGMH